MKKSALLFALFITAVSAIAQTNTFPANGSVGIGTTSPGLVGWGTPVLHLFNSAPYSGPGIEILGNRTYGNGALGGISFQNYLASAATKEVARIMSTTPVTFDADAGNLVFSTATTDGTLLDRMRIDENGNVGITRYLRVGAMPANPNGQFRIFGEQGVGAIEASSNRTAYLCASDGYYGASAYDYSTNTPVPFSLNFENTDTYINRRGGQVAIGSTVIPAGYKLAVAGNIIAEKIKVQMSPWPDYVFNPNYSLRPLKEVEAFIKANGHLPDVPPAAEVEKNGVDLGDNQALLLKKIEELTLYIIELKKENETLGQRLTSLEKGK